MFLSVRWCAEHMTQLPRLKVTGQGQRIYPLILCPLHISWTLQRIFIKLHPMFLSVKQCAEPITRLCWLGVKVTLQGHVIYPSICVCSVSPKPFERFSLNFTQMFPLVSRCAEHMTQLPWLKVKVSGFCVRSISLEFFWQFPFTSLKCFAQWDCVEHITQLPRLNVKVTGQGI